MKKYPILVIGFTLLSCFVLSSCSAQEAKTTSSPTETAAAVPASDSAGNDSAEAADSSETNAEETETYEERSIHISLVDDGMQAEYAYRSFIQIPIGMAFGPDGCMYICDWGGKHIVKVDKEGNMCDLELWRNNRYIQQDGPRGIDFDSQGNLYFNNHGYIFRLNTDGSLEILQNIASCQPIGSIAISPDDILYYTDRGNGKVYSWTQEGGSELVASDLPGAENMAFGLDGTMYLTQLGVYDLMALDVETGEVRIFAENVCQFDPCYLMVDEEGDIWARAIFTLTQITPDGDIKAYTVNGKDWTNYEWHTSGGIAIDDDGAIWMASHNSKVLRFAPTEPNVSDPEYNVTVVHYGLEAYDLAVDSEGNVYGTDINAGSIIKVGKDKQLETYISHGSQAHMAVAVDKIDLVYYSTDRKEIIKVEEDGSHTVYAQGFYAFSMVFGADGALYAAAGGDGEQKIIVKITNNNEIATVATGFEGVQFGTSEVIITPATDQGLFVLDRESQIVYFMDFNGDGYPIMNLADLGYYTQTIVASPITGDLYFLSNYNLFRRDTEGNVEHVCSGVAGDPWGMVVSNEGEELYIAASGAILALKLN